MSTPDLGAHANLTWGRRAINTVSRVLPPVPGELFEHAMRTLRSSDLTALANLIDSLGVVAPEAVPARLTAGVLDVVPGVLASYNEFGPGTTQVTAVDPESPHVPGENEAFARFLHQHPVIAVHGPAGIHSASAISDHTTPRALRRLDLYHEPLPASGDRGPDRQQRRGPRRRSRSAWRSAGPAGGSPNATLLVTVPGEAQPLVALEQTIAPSAARMAALGLTAREGEILLAAAQGLAEAGIAQRFAVTTRTVDKHLEHKYRKLDVTGRRQAVAAAFA